MKTQYRGYSIRSQSNKRGLIQYVTTIGTQEKIHKYLIMAYTYIDGYEYGMENCIHLLERDEDTENNDPDIAA